MNDPLVSERIFLKRSTHSSMYDDLLQIGGTVVVVGNQFKTTKILKLGIKKRKLDTCSRMQLSDKPYHKDLFKILTHDKFT